MHFRYFSEKKKQEREELEKTEGDNSTRRNIELDNTLSQWDSNLCQLCTSTKENTKHVVICNHEEATTYRMQQLTLFITWLSTQRSDPSFRDCISTVF